MRNKIIAILALFLTGGGDCPNRKKIPSIARFGLKSNRGNPKLNESSL